MTHNSCGSVIHTDYARITLVRMSDFLELLCAEAEGRDEATEGARVRLESVAFECLASGLADDRVASLLRLLGFDGDCACFAVAGRPAGAVPGAIEAVHRTVSDLGGQTPLVGVRDGGVAALIRAEAAVGPEITCTALSPAFAVDETPLCLGPLRHGVAGAAATLVAALTTLRAAPAIGLPHAADRAEAAATAIGLTSARTRGVEPLRAEDVLPERALLGDTDARRELVDVVYASLAGDNPDDPTMRTVATFLTSGGSLETTARTLNVHPNTVRYRLKRAADTTGWDATDPREAYVLTTAIALGRILRPQPSHP